MTATGMAREVAACWWLGVRTAAAPALAIGYLTAAFLAPTLVYGPPGLAPPPAARPQPAAAVVDLHPARHAERTAA